MIGRGGVGKTTLLRWAAERADQADARMVVAAADPLNRSLRLYRDNVVEPPSNDPAATADWTQALLLRCMELGASALLDLGGGDTSLHRLLQTVPDLAAVLHDGGLEAVAVHVVGANPHDLVPLAETEAAGFQPASDRARLQRTPRPARQVRAGDPALRLPGRARPRRGPAVDALSQPRRGPPA